MNMSVRFRSLFLTNSFTIPLCSSFSITMWQVLLAVAVAASTGFITNHFLKHTKHSTDHTDDPATTLQENPISHSLPLPDAASQIQDGIFRFSSLELRKDGFRSRPNDSRKKPLIGRQRSKHGIRIAKGMQRSHEELRSPQSKDGNQLSFCLKRRKMIKNRTASAGFCSSKDGSIFGWGLSFGIMYMMSAGKSEISKLNKAMDETAKVVQELKSELHRRRSSRTQKILDSVDNNDMKSRKISGSHDNVMLEKTSSEVRDTDVRISSLPAVSDDGECGSSALTEESDQRTLEMEQLEAELELELQKLPGCTIDSPQRTEHHKLHVADEGCDGTESNGVLASELNQKLSHLLIERQENQIAELESELHFAQSKLHEKEGELQALKDSVRRLTQLSLSAISDDETDADQEGSNKDSNNMECESKQSVCGIKRPIDSESCAYYYNLK